MCYSGTSAGYSSVHELTYGRTKSGSRMTPHICRAAQSVTSLHRPSHPELLNVSGLKKKKKTKPFKGFKTFKIPTACSLGPMQSEARAPRGFGTLQHRPCKPRLRRPWTLIIVKNISKTPKTRKPPRDQFVLFSLALPPEGKN